jgi:murein DD-endopeptidase MepM/ murein hydrolase activator NlpD
MQKNGKGRKAITAVAGVLKANGYYIVLVLCIAAVGISGYLFLRTAMSAQRAASAAQELTLDVPLTATVPDEEPAPSEDSKQTVGMAETAETAEPVETVPSITAMTDAEVGQIAAEVVIRPLSGATQKAYSMDALVYSATMADWRVHNGIDIAAVDGSTVLAAKGGTVSAVYVDDFYGTVVELTHTDGWKTVYANLTETALVSVGDTVEAGDVLGAVGDTAIAECADEPHLHFEVWHDGAPQDPETFLP